MRAAAVLLLSALLLSCGGGGGPAAPAPDSGVATSQFVSQNTGSAYTIDVYVPPAYAADTAAYPTIYVTESDAPYGISGPSAISRFANFKAILAQRGTRAILVGVSGTAVRTRDFLLPGAAAYHAFLVKELIPWVDARYRTSSKRALSGLSYGGTFVMTAFYLETEAGLFPFTHFLSSEFATPAAGTADAEFTALKGRALQPGRQAPGVTLHLAAAANNGFTNHILVHSLYTELNARALPGLTLVLTDHPTDSHVSVDGPAFDEALKRFFAP
ncbi:MAG: alpha/beta hydrolase-fold protein [Pseudomonadota bacterium]